MSSPDIDPMVSFGYRGKVYKVHMDVCARGVIRLPDDTLLVVGVALETYPPQIEMVRAVTDGDARTPVFEAVSADK